MKNSGPDGRRGARAFSAHQPKRRGVGMTALALAVGLAGCTSLSDHPEFKGLREVGAGAGDLSSVAQERRNVQSLANLYLKQAKALEGESEVAGAGLLGFGLYGAGTAAFNPAPTNLLAAMLGVGAFQGWRSGLKPGERAKVYVAGYRALDCVWAAGGPLETVGEDNADAAKGLRDEAFVALGGVHIARDRVESDVEDPQKAALLARLTAVENTLNALDAPLMLEANAMHEGPGRIGRVRRQIEDNIDKRLNGLAPDYAAVLKTLSESSKLPDAGGASGGTGKGAGPPSRSEPPSRSSEGAPPPPTPAELVADLEAEAARIRSQTPIVAATAYADLGHCLAVAG